DKQARPLDIPDQAAGYQPAQAPRVPGSSYAYPGASAAPGASTFGATSAKPATGRRLVIGEGISISGEIEACDHLVIDGTIEAALKGASTLDVTETGTFYGSVEINEATIAGRFEGEITVAGRLTVTATGSVIGSIT